MKTRTDKIRAARAQGSFSLIETVIALAIVSFLILEVAAVQGNSIVFSDYGRNVTQATWLARKVMTQVEYYWHTKPFKELETNVVDQKFEDFDDYSYSLEIKEWKFPFTQLLTSVLAGGKSDDGDKKDSKDNQDAGVAKMLESVVKQIFGDEPIFMTAHVDVSWAEGAQRNSSGMSYLLTNQAKLDEAIIQLKPVYDKLTKPPAKKTDNTPKKGGVPTAPGQPPVNPDQPPPDAGQVDGGNPP